MTLYSVTNSDGEIDAVSRSKLHALAFFPEDDISWYLAWHLLEAEHAFWVKSGAAAPTTSHFSKIVSNACVKRAQQVWVTGLVALGFFWLHAKGKRVSQNQAVEIAAAYAAAPSTRPFWFYNQDNEIEERQLALPSDHASIRQIFKKYRNAAHICAARVSCSEYLDPLPAFEVATQADRSFIATTSFFQHVFHREMDVEWGLRLIETPKGLSIGEEMLRPSDEVWVELLRNSTHN